MSYQVTKAFSLNAGYTGYFIGNIARASTNVIYSLPTMGLGSDTEEAFANGVHFGFEFNR